MRRLGLSLFLSANCCSLSLIDAHGAGLEKSQTRFVFTNADGKVESAKIITSFTGKSIYPFAGVNRKLFADLDPKMARAATIAEERAHAHSKSRCWQYVKEALLASGAVSSYPRTELARQAGDELVQSFGWTRLSVRDPYQAPVGAVLVYQNGRRAGHVEIRTPTGFASDYRSKSPCGYPLVAVYAKLSDAASSRVAADFRGRPF
jgi:hypothetical protein